ncbi:RCC1 domain-containing protein [Scrofimicrobium sp. R131]
MSVDSGRLNSYVLTDEGDIFSWGQNEVPQAGAGPGRPSQYPSER